MNNKILFVLLFILLLLATLTLPSCARRYDVRFELDGGIMPREDGKGWRLGDEYILPTPTKSGYEFEGWYLTEDFYGDPVESIILGDSESVTLYAKFVKLIKITYETAGGLTLNPTQVRQDEIIELAESSLDGYIFDGWYTDSSYKNKVTHLICPSNDLTLYAKYHGKYSVTYDTCGGENHYLNPDYYESNMGALLFAPERVGYKFLGWYNKATDEKISFIPLGHEGNLSLIAKWQVNTYSIEWVLNGGSVDVKLKNSYVYGVGLGDGGIPEAYREGSIFLGWYSITGEGESLIEAIDSETVGDLRVEAKFYTNDPRVLTDLFSLSAQTKEIEAEQLYENAYHIEIPEELIPFAEAGILGINIDACFTVGLRTQNNRGATLSAYLLLDGESHFVCSNTVKGGGNLEYGSWEYSTSSKFNSITVDPDGIYIGCIYYLSSEVAGDSTTDLIATCDSVSYSFYIIE